MFDDYIICISIPDDVTDISIETDLDYETGLETDSSIVYVFNGKINYS